MMLRWKNLRRLCFSQGFIGTAPSSSLTIVISAHMRYSCSDLLEIKVGSYPKNESQVLKSLKMKNGKNALIHSHEIRPVEKLAGKQKQEKTFRNGKQTATISKEKWKECHQLPEKTIKNPQKNLRKPRTTQGNSKENLGKPWKFQGLGQLRRPPGVDLPEEMEPDAAGAVLSEMDSADAAELLAVMDYDDGAAAVLAATWSDRGWAGQVSTVGPKGWTQGSWSMGRWWVPKGEL